MNSISSADSIGFPISLGAAAPGCARPRIEPAFFGLRPAYRSDHHQLLSAPHAPELGRSVRAYS